MDPTSSLGISMLNLFKKGKGKASVENSIAVVGVKKALLLGLLSRDVEEVDETDDDITSMISSCTDLAVASTADSELLDKCITGATDSSDDSGVTSNSGGAGDGTIKFNKRSALRKSSNYGRGEVNTTEHSVSFSASIDTKDTRLTCSSTASENGYPQSHNSSRKSISWSSDSGVSNHVHAHAAAIVRENHLRGQTSNDAAEQIQNERNAAFTPIGRRPSTTITRGTCPLQSSVHPPHETEATRQTNNQRRPKFKRQSSFEKEISSTSSSQSSLASVNSLSVPHEKQLKQKSEGNRKAMNQSRKVSISSSQASDESDFQQEKFRRFRESPRHRSLPLTDNNRNSHYPNASLDCQLLSLPPGGHSSILKANYHHPDAPRPTLTPTAATRGGNRVGDSQALHADPQAVAVMRHNSFHSAPGSAWRPVHQAAHIRRTDTQTGVGRTDNSIAASRAAYRRMETMPVNGHHHPAGLRPPPPSSLNLAQSYLEPPKSNFLLPPREQLGTSSSHHPGTPCRSPAVYSSTPWRSSPLPAARHIQQRSRSISEQGTNQNEKQTKHLERPGSLTLGGRRHSMRRSSVMVTDL